VYVKSISWKLLEDFLFYYQRIDGPEKWERKKWKVESCILPEILNLDVNCDEFTLPCEIAECFHNMKDVNHEESLIKCEKKICDIGEFILEWTKDNQKYNSFSNNCQRFAYQLYKYLIGNEYPEKTKEVQDLLQSWSDQVEASK